MGSQALLWSFLACTVSSVPLDAGYGTLLPAASLSLPTAPAHIPLSHLTTQPIFHSAPQPLISLPESIALAPIPTPTSSQFHAQDELGQFSFGYENINSAQTESKDALGVTRGSYQYTDANGIVQKVNYIADDINGFRVTGTNILERKKREAEDESSEPEPEPEPEADRKKRDAEPIHGYYDIPSGIAFSAPVHLPLQTQNIHQTLSLQPVPQTANKLASNLIYPSSHSHPLYLEPQQFALIPEQLRLVQESFINAPVHIPSPPLAPIPVSIPAPIPAPIQPSIPAFIPAPIQPSIPAHIPVPIQAPIPVPIPAPIPDVSSSQFHAQDELGQFSFGYENVNSAKTETKDAFGVTRGSYQYVDANGILQRVNYIADDINGFRVSGTNIPVAPEALPVSSKLSLPIPLPVKETPEVAAARQEHLAAHAEAKAGVEAANNEED